MSDRDQHKWRRDSKLGHARKAHRERQAEQARALQPSLKQDFLERLAARSERDGLPDLAA